MTSVCPTWRLDTIIDAMQRHRYTGLEPRVEWDHAAGIEATLSSAQRGDVRRRIGDAGLELCCIATGVRMATTAPAERTSQLSDAHRYIELAGDLGCPRLRLFGGRRDCDWQLHHLVGMWQTGSAS